MTSSVRLSKENLELFATYAKSHTLTVSEFVRQSALVCIEDEFDLKAYTTVIAA